MEHTRMDILNSQYKQVFFACVLTFTFLSILPWTGDCQGLYEERDIKGIFDAADNFRGFLIELAKIVTGTNIIKHQTSLKVVPRPPIDMTLLLDSVRSKMEKLLHGKQMAVERLKEASQKSMKVYGPYKEFIDFKDVEYFNAKKVVIEKDLDTMDEQAKEDIKETINYLPTNLSWSFKADQPRPQLNSNTSTIHVPTNIYDKSMRILNGVQWSYNLTQQYSVNYRHDPDLTWQYFCSSDGFFRVFPGMQWPRDADRVDTFDCRVRKWYIQAASSPKNILILLDSSGSMRGLRFAIAKSTVSTILDTLSDEDYFNVMQFAEEPTYVDDCFNDTLMPASVDNIKRMQEKIDVLAAEKYANFEKALTKAFKLFQKEQLEFDGQYLCNKAIMIVTDGAPENFDAVFDRFNWPKKSIRVFTFLIGKEVPDNRQARWMACANKGKFTHISTRADVQENVQKYIKVLSRPLAIQRANHKVWSPVYIDYVTEQSEIAVAAYRPDDLAVDFESESVYEGLGLVMTISMPVFDERDKVGPKEEEPERNLLGVVGTDVRINELMKLIPTYKLGVNGYAFAITNHGYILFHPDYRPFYSDKTSFGFQQLKVRTKYNSVELSEVEQPTYSGPGWNKEHPLRRYLLINRSGGDNMTTITVLTHCDGMKRAQERRNQYQFKEVANTFKLVFVVPDGYGTHYAKLDPSSVPTAEEIDANMRMEGASVVALSNWIYCQDGEGKAYVQLNMQRLGRHMRDGTLYEKCDEEHMQRLMKDIQITNEYSRVWEGTQNRYVKTTEENKYVKEYDRCWGSSAESQSRQKMICYFQNHLRYGIGCIWIGTSSGLTRFAEVDRVDPDWHHVNTQTIKSLYYKRAVDGWSDGYTFVFAGPVVTSQKDFDFNTSFITMSTAEIMGSSRPAQVPAAVVAFDMKYSAFYNKFVQYTFQCSDSSCGYTCNDTENFICYLIDNNGYILAINNPDRNGTGLFLGQHNGRLMRTLLEDGIFKKLKLTDYQAMCSTKVTGEQESASSFIMNPLRLIGRFFFWILSETVIFISEWNILSRFKPSSVWANKDDEKECGDWIPEQMARYLYCGFVVDEATGQRIKKDYAIQMRSCVQRVTRYTLNLSVLLARGNRHRLPDCVTQCTSKHQVSYGARWLNDTNLLFVVADASCICNASPTDEVATLGTRASHRKYKFNVIPKEVLYDDYTHCQILLNFSDDLKRVDNTRTPNTLCLDSSNETDKPCGQSPALTHSYVTSIIPALLTVLLVISTYCCH